MASPLVEQIEEEHEHQQGAADQLCGEGKRAKRTLQDSAGGVLRSGQDALEEVVDRVVVLLDPVVVVAQPGNDLVGTLADVLADPSQVAEERVGEYPRQSHADHDYA